jgi:hypothetical protein
MFEYRLFRSLLIFEVSEKTKKHLNHIGHRVLRTESTEVKRYLVKINVY